MSHRFLRVFASTMAFACASQAYAAAPASDEVHVSFKVKEIGGGIGYEWGKGQLFYNNKVYDFEVSGGGLGSIGYVSVTGNGKVTDMTKLGHFDGTYWTVRADAAAGSGTGVAELENQYGVRLHVNLSMQGAHLGASIMRLRFRLTPAVED